VFDAAETGFYTVTAVYRAAAANKAVMVCNGDKHNVVFPALSVTDFKTADVGKVEITRTENNFIEIRTSGAEWGLIEIQSLTLKPVNK